jgi:D-3-phosphoglycerate dehydrogenase
MLFVWNVDRPGMIGHVGTILGRRGVNIANMHVGRRDAGGTAVMVLTLDAALPPEVTREIGDGAGITAVRTTLLLKEP